ncbi:MAG TPA: oligopeptide/dipeptide ABC transporter ATP-binding protein [Roseomonas sp.]|nr:oligopeptide/dipeptide ABC transporter ATP-binding protein [Roseomonas sp.]
MSAPAVEIRNLCRQFRIGGGLGRAPRLLTAVDDVSLAVPDGGVLGIVGESGCGKSTLARIVMGLLAPSSGEVRVAGRSLAALDRRERARLIQLVPQDPFSSLNPRRRVSDNIALPLLAQGGMTKAEMARRVAAMMARVGLRPDMGQRYPAELSGGQRQRVAIARALVLRPRIVVCDEPTSALDVSVQAQILNMLAELRREMGLTLLFISHNLAVVEHVATEVAVMYLGRVVEHAAAARLFREPRHPYTRALLNSVLTPEPGLGIPDSGLGDIPPDPSNLPTGCRFNPRCRQAEALCGTAAPPRLAGPGTAECHFAERPPAPPALLPAER